MGWTAYFGIAEVLIKCLLRNFLTAEQLEAKSDMGVK